MKTCIAVLIAAVLCAAPLENPVVIIDAPIKRVGNMVYYGSGSQIAVYRNGLRQKACGPWFPVGCDYSMNSSNASVTFREILTDQDLVIVDVWK